MTSAPAQYQGGCHLADQFTYAAGAPPTVTGISPNSGSAAGGDLVTEDWRYQERHSGMTYDARHLLSSGARDHHLSHGR